MPIRPLLDLRPLADDTLISQLKSLVRRERAITVAVLLRLIEVERRGLHLRRYSSLFLYCVDRLGYSRSAAGRRIYAAHRLRDFPRVYEMLLQGRLNLTTLCIVGRVLTQENEADLLQRVAGKSEKEVERIVAALSRPIHPREIIRPIRVRTGGAASTAPRTGPSARVSGGGVSNANVSSAGAPNADGSSADVSNVLGAGGPKASVPDADVLSPYGPPALSSGSIDVTTSDGNGTTSIASLTPRAALVTGSRGDAPLATDSCETPRPVAGAPVTLPPGTGTLSPGRIDSSGSEAPLSYRIAITVDGAFMEKLERARALVSRSRPGVSVADVFGKTLDEFLMRHDPEARMARRQQRTEKKRAATRRSQDDAFGNGTGAIGGSVVSCVSADASYSISGNASRGVVEDTANNVTGFLTGDVSCGTPQVAQSIDPAVDPAADSAVDPVVAFIIPQSSRRWDLEPRPETPHRSSDPTMRREKVRRGTGGSSDPGYITAAMRDAVWVRDGGRCTYVGPEGRCPETRGLHINHRVPKSLGGVAELWNLDLACGCHNQSEADRVLGKDFMDLRRRRTPGPRVAAPEIVRSSGGDALRGQTEHVELPGVTDANPAST